MMKKHAFKIAGLAAALAVSGCATAVTSVSRDHVSIRFDAILDSAESLQRLADAQCAEYGRSAMFDRRTDGPGLGAGTAHYSCIDKPAGD